MKYREAIAAIFWAWWHSGEWLSVEIMRSNQWARHPNVHDALKEFSSLTIQMLNEQPAMGNQLVWISPDTSWVNLIADPRCGQEFFHQALILNIHADELVGPHEVDYHVQLYFLYLLLFSMSCYACHNPDGEIPISEDEIEEIRDRIEGRLNGWYSPEEIQISDIAQRIAGLTEEGREFVTLPRMAQLTIPLKYLT